MLSYFVFLLDKCQVFTFSVLIFQHFDFVLKKKIKKKPGNKGHSRVNVVDKCRASHISAID